VAIGRAIVRDARLFLFDEPLSNLDAQLRDDMRTEIKRLHQELKRTMIYVTHDQIEAMTLADRIVLLRDGVIEQQGTPLELFDRPKTKFVAGFLGSPKMNFVKGTLDGKSITLADGTRLPFAGSATARAVYVGIRPQHITRATGPAAKNQIAVPVTIELVQPTGSRTQVSFPFGGQSIVAEFDAAPDDAPGSKIKIAIDMSRAVVIDAQTEQVIS
jgi:multiple sugar transport system ATP-binding protein